jgi:hypothetical protein
MSIRINLDNKTLNKERYPTNEYEESSDWNEEEENNINTPRGSCVKINDLSKKKILVRSTSGYSRNNPSTTDKLSNNSLDSYFKADKNKFESYEIEREYVIEGCEDYKIRTPVKKDTSNSNQDLKTNVGPENSPIIDKSISHKERYSECSDHESRSNKKYAGLKSVAKNLNVDFNKVQLEFSTSKDSKQYILFLFNYF